MQVMTEGPAPEGGFSPEPPAKSFAQHVRVAGVMHEVDTQSAQAPGSDPAAILAAIQEEQDGSPLPAPGIGRAAMLEGPLSPASQHILLDNRVGGGNEERVPIVQLRDPAAEPEAVYMKKGLAARPRVVDEEQSLEDRSAGDPEQQRLSTVDAMSAEPVSDPVQDSELKTPLTEKGAVGHERTDEPAGAGQGIRPPGGNPPTGKDASDGEEPNPPEENGTGGPVPWKQRLSQFGKDFWRGETRFTPAFQRDRAGSSKSDNDSQEAAGETASPDDLWRGLLANKNYKIAKALGLDKVDQTLTELFLSRQLTRNEIYHLNRRPAQAASEHSRRIVPGEQTMARIQRAIDLTTQRDYPDSNRPRTIERAIASLVAEYNRYGFLEVGLRISRKDLDEWVARWEDEIFAEPPSINSPERRTMVTVERGGDNNDVQVKSVALPGRNWVDSFSGISHAERVRAMSQEVDNQLAIADELGIADRRERKYVVLSIGRELIADGQARRRHSDYPNALPDDGYYWASSNMRVASAIQGEKSYGRLSRSARRGLVKSIGQQRVKAIEFGVHDVLSRALHAGRTKEAYGKEAERGLPHLDVTDLEQTKESWRKQLAITPVVKEEEGTFNGVLRAARSRLRERIH